MRVYELYLERLDNTIIFCDTFYLQREVIEEMNALSSEFPENLYWYETVEVEE